MTTLREHAEAIKALPSNSMLTAAEKLAFAEVRALAILDALDAAERGSKTTIMRNFALVHDPAPRPSDDAEQA